MGLWPSPWICGNTNHIQWLVLRPVRSSARTRSISGSCASTKRSRLLSGLRAARHLPDGMAVELRLGPLPGPARVRHASVLAPGIEQYHDDRAVVDHRLHDETVASGVGEAGLLHDDVPGAPVHQHIGVAIGHHAAAGANGTAAAGGVEAD